MSDKQKKSNSALRRATISITHQNLWDKEKHAAAFLQPIIEGLLKRLAKIDKL